MRLLSMVCALFASALLPGADGFAGGWGTIGRPSARMRPSQRSAGPALAHVKMLHKEPKRFPGLDFTGESLSKSTETLSRSLSVNDGQRKAEIERCLAQYNAVYTILWEKDGDGPFRVKGQYTIEARRRALRKVRGDDKTFASESAKIAIPSKGTNLIATASQTGKEQIISNPGSIWSLKRRFLAQEFGIRHIHFVPVNDGTGEKVMEYGRLSGEELEIIRLLRLSVPLLTSPASLTDFIKGCMETFWLLLLLVPPPPPPPPPPLSLSLSLSLFSLSSLSSLSLYLSLSLSLSHTHTHTTGEDRGNRCRGRAFEGVGRVQCRGPGGTEDRRLKEASPPSPKP